MKAILRRHQWTLACAVGVLLFVAWIGSYFLWRHSNPWHFVTGQRYIILMPRSLPESFRAAYLPLAELEFRVTGNHVGVETESRIHLGATAQF